MAAPRSGTGAGRRGTCRTPSVPGRARGRGRDRTPARRKAAPVGFGEREAGGGQRAAASAFDDLGDGVGGESTRLARSVSREKEALPPTRVEAGTTSSSPFESVVTEKRVPPRRRGRRPRRELLLVRRRAPAPAAASPAWSPAPTRLELLPPSAAEPRPQIRPEAAAPLSRRASRAVSVRVAFFTLRASSLEACARRPPPPRNAPALWRARAVARRALARPRGSRAFRAASSARLGRRATRRRGPRARPRAARDGSANEAWQSGKAAKKAKPTRATPRCVGLGRCTDDAEARAPPPNIRPARAALREPARRHLARAVGLGAPALFARDGSRARLGGRRAGSAGGAPSRRTSRAFSVFGVSSRKQTRNGGRGARVATPPPSSGRVRGDDVPAASRDVASAPTHARAVQPPPRPSRRRARRRARRSDVLRPCPTPPPVESPPPPGIASRAARRVLEPTPAKRGLHREPRGGGRERSQKRSCPRGIAGESPRVREPAEKEPIAAAPPRLGGGGAQPRLALHSPQGHRADPRLDRHARLTAGARRRPPRASRQQRATALAAHRLRRRPPHPADAASSREARARARARAVSRARERAASSRSRSTRRTRSTSSRRARRSASRPRSAASYASVAVSSTSSWFELATAEDGSDGKSRASGAGAERPRVPRASPLRSRIRARISSIERATATPRVLASAPPVQDPGVRFSPTPSKIDRWV